MTDMTLNEVLTAVDKYGSTYHAAMALGVNQNCLYRVLKRTRPVKPVATSVIDAAKADPAMAFITRKPTGRI